VDQVVFLAAVALSLVPLRNHSQMFGH
jgi:hypothetical protein